MKLNTKLVWRTLVTLIGLTSAILGIYAFFFQEKTLKIEYEVLASTNVLDINADITKLDITYDNTSLKSNNKGLRIINIRVRNTGTDNILKSFYDNNDPLGLLVANGTIIEKPELIGTSSEYIKKNLKIEFNDSNGLTFNSLILEPNEFFTLKLLILHSVGQNPEVSSIGKIAGIKKIPVISLVQEANREKSFWKATFGGNVFSQLLRLFVYTWIFIFLMAVIAVVVSSISEFFKKKKRFRVTKKYIKENLSDYKKESDIIFKKFEDVGSDEILEYYNLLKDEEILNQTYKDWSKIKTNVKKEDFVFRKLEQGFFISDKGRILKELINDGYVTKEKEKLIINQSMKNDLELFVGYLKENKLINVDMPISIG